MDRLTRAEVMAWAADPTVLSIGYEGPEVTIFERLCAEIDPVLYRGVLDDDFGKGCRSAAFDFQQYRLLEESGKVDQRTKADMVRAWECGCKMGDLFVPLRFATGQQVYGPRHPVAGFLPGVVRGKPESGRMSTFGGPHDSGDRIYGQAYWSDASSPQDLISRQPELVEMGVIMTAEQALSVRYGEDDWKPGELFFEGDLSRWPMTKGCGKVRRAGASSMLNPASYFIAMMFDSAAGLYNEHNPKLLVWSEKTKRGCIGIRTDKGPDPDTNRICDLSDGIADALYLEVGDGKKLPTDSEVYVTWAPDDAKIGPVELFVR